MKFGPKKKTCKSLFKNLLLKI